MDAPYLQDVVTWAGHFFPSPLLLLFFCTLRPIHSSAHPSIHPFIHPSIHLYIHPSINQFVCPSFHVYIHPSTHPFMYLSTYPSNHPLIRPSIPSLYSSLFSSIHSPLQQFQTILLTRADGSSRHGRVNPRINWCARAHGCECECAHGCGYFKETFVPEVRLSFV